MDVNVTIPQSYYHKNFKELSVYSVDFYKQIVEELFDNDKLNDDGELSEEMAEYLAQAIVIGAFLADGDFSHKEYELFSVLLPDYKFSYDEAKAYCFEVEPDLSESLKEMYYVIIELHLRDIAVLMTKLTICCIVIDGIENCSEHEHFSFFAAGIKSLVSY